MSNICKVEVMKDGLPGGSYQGQQIYYEQPKQQLYQETFYSQQLKEEENEGRERGGLIKKQEWDKMERYFRHNICRRNIL